MLSCQSMKTSITPVVTGNIAIVDSDGAEVVVLEESIILNSLRSIKFSFKNAQVKLLSLREYLNGLKE